MQISAPRLSGMSVLSNSMTLPIVLVLMFVGWVMVASASIEYSQYMFDNSFHYIVRHLVYLVMAIIAMILSAQVSFELWQKVTPLLLVIGFGLLILVITPAGHEVNGSSRWLRLPGFTVQPSELMKLFVLMYLCGFLVRQGDVMRERWFAFIRPLVVIGMAALLLIAEPDYGATVVVIATCLAVMFIAGAPAVPFILMIVLAVAVMGGWAVSDEYRVLRLTAYTDPWADKFGSGYQLVQSLIAFGRGEWAGVGLGSSVQKLFYLPEAHTDFVFAIWAEETGLIGSTILVFALYFLFLRSVAMGRKLQQVNEFASYLVTGIAVMMAGQAFINMGVACGLLPTKGLTLPFISYGGSSLIVSGVMAGMLIRGEFELRRAEQDA